MVEWQTRRSQKPVRIIPRVGSTPTLGTQTITQYYMTELFILIYLLLASIIAYRIIKLRLKHAHWSSQKKEVKIIALILLLTLTLVIGYLHLTQNNYSSTLLEES